MPIRIVKSPIHLTRDGKVVIPRIGEAFDFTAAEIEQINKADPKALKHIVLPEKQTVKDEPQAKKG